MAQKHELKPSAPWYRIEADESDWSALPARELVRLYAQMKLIRRFEEKILDLEKAGLIHGPAHSSIGQEAAAVGAVSMLRANDQINGTHRAHHYDPSVFPDPERFDINRIHAGLTTFGKGIHICPGRHLGVMLIRVLLDVFLEKDIEVELSGDRVTWIPRHMVNQLSAMPAIVKRRTG